MPDLPRCCGTCRSFKPVDSEDGLCNIRPGSPDGSETPVRLEHCCRSYFFCPSRTKHDTEGRVTCPACDCSWPVEADELECTCPPNDDEWPPS